MFIFQNNYIAHMPKCGGHALNKMMTQAKMNFKTRFNIKNNKANKPIKHQPFSALDHLDVNKHNFYCLFRRLDDWWKSFMWHQSKHVTININNCVKKIEQMSYSNEAIKTPGHLLLPKVTCWSIFPDHYLSYMIFPFQPKFIRMEYLREDFKKYFDIELPKIEYVTTYKPPTKYWTEDTQKILYENNPKWAAIEANIYPDKELDF